MAGVSTFSQDIADAICERIISGDSLRHICDDDSMPSASTVFKWLRDIEAFSQQYARAKTAQAEVMAEELLDIAEDGRNDWIEVENKRGGGTHIELNREAIERSRMRIDVRKWLMSKMMPKKYGDKLELSGDVTHSYAARLPAPQPDAEKWQQQHSPAALPPTMQ